MNNPYSAPGADLSVESNGNDEYQPKIFTWNGRIGRLRYLGYSFLVTLAIYAVIGVAVAVFAALGFMGTNLNPVALGTLGFVVFIVLFSFTLLPIKRRLNDLNQSGWLGLLMLIPLVNLFFSFYLLFGRGTDGSNNYGPKPNKNPRGMIFVALLLPIFAVVGILAAVALPAYQDYAKKSREGAIRQMTDAPQQDGAGQADPADPAAPAAAADAAAPTDAAAAAPADAAAPAEPAAKP